jgi:hypothetical protein
MATSVWVVSQFRFWPARNLLTNAFSKKIENLEFALALYFFHYNFIARHQTLRMPPALKAHVADHMWTLDELIG